MPASFPNSVKAFSNRSAGQVIGSAHVNDLQDEVAAIEQVIVNGPINLQASTLASLSVAGGSTLNALNSSNSTLANLSVTGGSTFTGSALFSSLVTMSGQPRTVLSQTSSQSLGTGAAAAVSFATETIDVGGLHSTASSPTRVTIPAGSSGTYMFSGMVVFNTSSAGTRTAFVAKNGTEVAGSRGQIQGAPTFNTYLPTATVIAFMDAADFAELFAQQDSGSTLSIGVAAASGFTVARLY